MSAAALTIGPGASGAPGVFSLDRLRLEAGGPENYIFTAGNRVVPDGGVDTGAYYRTVVADGAGVIRNGTSPCLPAAAFETTDNSYEVKLADPVSTSAGWTFSLRQFSTSDCSGSPTKTAAKVFYVGKATPYNSSNATTVQNRFRAGTTAYVAVAGMPPGVADFNVYWIGPSGAVVCGNTAGGDRPDADSDGTLPRRGGGVLQYRPGSAGQQWNRESNYEIRPCADFSSANEGAWKLRLVLNATNSVDLAAFDVDTTAPAAPVLDGTPPLLSASAAATFSFSSSEPGTSFLCRLDGTGAALFSACSSPATYSGLVDGSHTFEVKALDIAGNESAVTAFTWTIDRTAPQVTLTAPAGGSSTGGTPTFAGQAGIAAGDHTTVTVKVYAGGSANGTPVQTLTTNRDGVGAYTATPSIPLGDGTYTAQAEQDDDAGNIGRSGPVTFSVDVAAPETTIDSQPSDPSGSDEATFTFSASDAGSTFACQLDGGGFSACTSPTSYSGLIDGSHTFQVRATDTAGNTDPTPASFTWTIDAAGPDTSIDSSPPLLSNSTAGTFTFAASEPGATFACQLDGGGYSACTSPKSYSGLTDGSHTFQVRATDGAGNTDPSPASFTWTIDTAAPNTTIDSHPADPSASASAPFSFSASEPGSTFACQLDGGGYTACTSPKAYSGLGDGSHTFQVRATDPAGNTDPTPASFTWTIDTAAPNTTIDTAPSDPSASASATFTFSASEPGSTFACQLDGGGYSACTSPTSYSGLAGGSHTFQVRATDTTGNTDPTPASHTWTIDLTSPQITLTQPASGATTGATPTFAGQAGTVAGDQTTVTVKIYAGGSATGSPVQTLTTTRAGGGAYSTAATTPLTNGTYTARSEQLDAAGNLGTSSPNTFTVSSGGPGGSTYRADVLSDNPVAYWRLGEPSGTVAASELGATTNGTYENGVTLGQTGALTADSNTAAGFDGVDDIVTVPHSSALNATSGVTIEAWVKRSKTGAWQNILGKPGNGANAAQNYALWLNTTNQPVALFGNGTTSVAAYAPAIDTNWHHIAATYNNATAQVYVDGVLKVSSSSNVQLTANTQPLRIGRTSDNVRIFGGIVDEVAVYPTVLSATRIQAHYTAATSVDTTPPAVTLTTPSDGSVVGPTPNFSGAAGNASGDLSTVTLRIYSGNTTGGQLVQTRTTSASAGSWSVNASPALEDGIYTAQAQQADSVGNVGLSSPATFTVTSADITPPAVTVTTPPDGSSGADPTPLYAGGAGTAPGDLPTITVNVYLGLTPSGEPLQTYSTAEAGGSWSVQGDTLPDGVYTVRAEQDDAAGNLGLSVPHRFTVGTSYRDDVLSDNPAGYWRLGESSGTTAASEVGATTNGTYANGVTLGQTGALTADSNTAAGFDGVNDIVTVPHSSALNATSGVTIQAWVKRSKTGAWQNILGKPGNGANAAQNYALWLNTTNQPVALFGNGTTSVAAYAPAIDTNWHHIAATYNNATVRVYIDGVLRASTDSNLQLKANTQPLLIGRTTDNLRIFGGTLDEVAVYPTALSATRIQAHYQKGTAADPVPPVVTLSTPPDGSTTLDTRPHFAGVAEVTASDSSTVTVKIYAGSSPSGTPLQTLTTTRFTSGTWSVDASSALALGTYTAQAEQGDVSGNVGKSAASTFTVAASSSSPDPVLVGAGDIADCTDTGVNQTANLVLGFPDATVQTFGDNAYPHGSANDFANCYDPTWGQFKNRTNPAIGDHEYETPNASGYFNYFADRLAPFGASAQDPLRAYYSYDLGAWHVVVLNAICYEISGCSVNGQLAWLNADLAAHTNTCTLAVLAAPRWSSGTVHGNNAQMQGYWDSFHSNQVDVVVGGDDHVYERFAPQDPQGFYAPGRGVRQFTVGTGGGSLYTFGEPKANSEVRYRSSYGILKLGLHATSYDWRYVPTSGTFADTGSDTCN